MLASHDGETDGSRICEVDAEDTLDLDKREVGATVALPEAIRELKLNEELKLECELRRTSESKVTDNCQALDRLHIHSLLTSLRKSDW